MTWKELLAKAKAALAAGNITEAEDLTRQATAAKAIEVLELEPTIKATAEPLRLPFASAEDKPADTTKSAQEWAAKRWYVKKYGEPEPAFVQIAKEIYPESEGDYFGLASAKYVDFNHYLKYGHADPRMSRIVLLSQDQLAEAIIQGVSISEIKATMVEAQDTLGGYTVPEDFHTEIISRLPGMTVVRSLATVRQTVRDVYTQLKRTGGDGRYIGNVRVFKAEETPTNASVTATNSTFGKVAIPIHTLMANVSLSLSLFEDSAVDLAADLQEEFSTARAIFEDEQYLIGNGIGGPQGILLGSTTQGPPTLDPAITTLPTGSATALTGDAFRKAPFSLGQQYRQNAHWAMAKATRAALVGLKDGQGRYLLGDNGNALAGPAGDQLIGYGIKESEALGAVAANYYPVIFGDFKGYKIVDRVGMTIRRYEDSTTATQDSVMFVMRWRGGGQVTNGEQFVVIKVATS